MHVTWPSVVVVVFAIGSACHYEPGAFARGKHTFPGQRATAGCLDVAVDRRGDLDGMAVLAYEFGNRCERPALVDLAHVRVVGRTRSGAEHALAPYDPDRELRPLAIDGRFAGGEAIAYRAGEPLAQVCVDVASLTTPRRAPQWLCFAQTDPDAFAHAKVTP